MKASIPVGDAYLSPHVQKSASVVEQFDCTCDATLSFFLL